MLRIKNFFLRFIRINSYLIFSLPLIVVAILLISYSLKNISFLRDEINNFTYNDTFFSEDYYNVPSQKYASITPSIKIKPILKEKNFNNFVVSNDKTIHSQNTSPKTVVSAESPSLLSLESLHLEFNTGKDIDIKKKKFIVSLLPSITQENERISALRTNIFQFQDHLLNTNKTLNKNEQRFLERLAAEYSLVTVNKHKVDVIEELLESIDIIPNSIVLAQAANETGWGSSRFAKEFNALFGEYTFDETKGVVPYYRENGKRHLIKFFPTINDSIKSYFKNINTHFAYKDFRKKRKLLRDHNLYLEPLTLINFLNSYAEDQNYTQTIKSIIKVNKLNRFDNVILLATNS